MKAAQARKHLAKLADRKAAASLQKYFKTGPGDYGEGDQFIGIRVPQLHEAADLFCGLPHEDVDELLRSPIHEHRSLALMILVRQYGAGDAKQREKIFRHYLRRTKYVNNWDLVDCSARDIVGRHLYQGDVSLLDRLARSPSLWERRIAIVATYYFICQRKFDVTIRLAGALLKDEHDLMHKAVGWMLREVGKRDPMTLDRFLDRHAGRMPRTALRYAIERMPAGRRQRYLKMPRVQTAWGRGSFPGRSQGSVRRDGRKS